MNNNDNNYKQRKKDRRNFFFFKSWVNGRGREFGGGVYNSRKSMEVVRVRNNEGLRILTSWFLCNTKKNHTLPGILWDLKIVCNCSGA
uniref:Uncharacterized protein n=1 Tax=Octopus bimaculoides TaxID=37653 RepID=A0A0L8FVH8_OCTBM